MRKKVLILANHFVTIYKFRKELVCELVKEGYDVVISLPFSKDIDKSHIRRFCLIFCTFYFGNWYKNKAAFDIFQNAALFCAFKFNICKRKSDDWHIMLFCVSSLTRVKKNGIIIPEL